MPHLTNGLLSGSSVEYQVKSCFFLFGPKKNGLPHLNDCRSNVFDRITLSEGLRELEETSHSRNEFLLHRLLFLFSL